MGESTFFDCAGAQRWKEKVDAELDEVASLLKEISQLRITIPGEDDPIFMAIDKLASVENEAWEKLTNTFKEVSTKTGEIISSWGKGVSDAFEKIQKRLEDFSL